MLIKFESVSKMKVLKEFKESEFFYLDGLKMKPVCESKDIAYVISKELNFYSIPPTMLGTIMTTRRLDYKEISEQETATRLFTEDKSVIALIDGKYCRSVRDFDTFAEILVESENSSVVFLVQ